MKRKAKTVELLPPLYTGSSTPKFDAQKCLKLLGFENRRTCPSNLGKGSFRRPSSTPRNALKLPGLKPVELPRRTWAPIGKGKFDAQVRRFWLTTIRGRVRSIAAATIQAPRPPALTTGGRDLPQRIGAHRETP